MKQNEIKSKKQKQNKKQQSNQKNPMSLFWVG